MSNASRGAQMRLEAKARSRARSAAARVAAACLAASLTLASSVASPQSRTAFLLDRLKSDDARVRTQAALALGGTNDDAALAPLCSALADEADLVRQAVAAAIKRLNRTRSAECLRVRLTVEKSEPVKLQISRALESIETGGTGDAEPATDDAPKLVPNAKFYVALSTVANNTGRPQPEVERVVGAAVRSKLDTLGIYQRAPMKEAPDTARAVMSKRKLKGYYLAVSVDKFAYVDGNLRVRVKVAVFTYPGKDLRGEVPAGVTQTGVSPGDRESEDNLMGIAAGRAVELFAQNFQ